MNRSPRPIRYNRITGLPAAGTFLLISMLVSTSVAAPPCLRPNDDLWIVSTRHLGCPVSDPPDLRVQSLDPESGWQSSDISTLLADESTDRLWVVYVHGNRLENNEVTRDAWNMYRCITADRPDAPAIRFVAWSWPSGQRHGPLRDVRSKAARTESDSYYLAWFLAQLPAERPLSLVGYSFGARIITGASHLLGGGRLSGRMLTGMSETEDVNQPLDARPRVVLMAAASHSYWLRPGCYHELALSRIGYLLNIFNSCDPVLRRYHAVDTCSHPDALGYEGMYTGDLGADAERIEQLDARCIVGREHAVEGYQRDRGLRSRIQQYVFRSPPGPTATSRTDHDGEPDADTHPVAAP